ncbi:MAG: DNA-binding response regulator [Planctomycetaceae bacterium]|nr:DNA-binding response regulator [Planctomycetaceae bacterium]
MRILVVEDEDALRNGLRFNFEQEGYKVATAGDGPSAIEQFRSAEPPIDLVVLDLMLPGMSGYEICRMIRDRDLHVPILALSARTLSEDKAQAFDCGTDQYMTKPFDLPELLSRVRNLLERSSLRSTLAADSDSTTVAIEKFDFDDGRVVVDFTTFEINVDGSRNSLTTMEVQLLKYFIQNEGRVLSRSQILTDVWEESADVTTRSIDNFVLRLRKQIEPNPAEPKHILSVRGTGYRFVAKPE